MGLAFFLGVSFVGLEILSRAYSEMLVFPALEATKADPLHFYRGSDNPILGYELRPGFSLENGGRLLRVNDHGIRESSNGLFREERRVALLGDSVLFAVGRSQHDTIAARVQSAFDAVGEGTRILNFAVPGYAIAQVAENFEVKNEIYDVDAAVYLLNLNDFSRRDSVYEGADNGLYRTYHHPLSTSAWFVRKAIYRYMKGNAWGDAGWYRWFFEGNEARGYACLDQMLEYAKSREIDFSVVLLPAGAAYLDGEYVLADIHRRIEGHLRARGVPVFSPIDEFSAREGELIDETDHMHPAGIDLMGRLMAEFLRKNGGL